MFVEPFLKVLPDSPMHSSSQPTCVHLNLQITLLFLGDGFLILGSYQKLTYGIVCFEMLI